MIHFFFFRAKIDFNIVRLVDEILFTKGDYMKSYFSNKLTDCILYSEEGLKVNVHKEILGQTDFLRKILSNIKHHCCNVLKIFCPCSESDLKFMVKFLYMGKIICETEEKLIAIVENLNKIFGFSKECLLPNEGTEKPKEVNIVK